MSRWFMLLAFLICVIAACDAGTKIHIYFDVPSLVKVYMPVGAAALTSDAICPSVVASAVVRALRP